MKKFNVGLQLYSVRNSMAEDFEGTLKAVKDMGYDTVEFAGYFGRSGEEIKAILDKLGLRCVSVHQGLDFFKEEPEKKIEFLKTFGVKYSIIPWYKKEELAGSEAWERTAELFRSTAELFAKHGLKLGYHNHDFEFDLHGGKYLYDYIFEAVDADKIEPEIDTCWVRYAGLMPDEKIRDFSGRVTLVHLKDFVCKKLASGPAYALIDANGNPIEPSSKEDNGFEFRPVGSGMQDFAAILKACEECGTQTVIVEQDKTYGDMSELEAARISREYLKNTFDI